MTLSKIKFTHVWDKLNDPEFTTMRSWNLGKEKYYHSLLGSEFQVWKIKAKYPFRTEHVLFHAWLSSVNVLEPKNIPRIVLEKDVSLNGSVDTTWLDKIMKMDRVIVLNFSKVPVKIQKQLEIDQ